MEKKEKGEMKYEDKKKIQMVTYPCDRSGNDYGSM